MEKEIIYDKTSEEYKAIKMLEIKATNYSDDGLILHYNIILYNLIINLMKENKKQKEIINNTINFINTPWSFKSGNKKVDEIIHQKKIELIKLLKDVGDE